MKKLITIIAAMFLVFSCSPKELDENEPIVPEYKFQYQLDGWKSNGMGNFETTVEGKSYKVRKHGQIGNMTIDTISRTSEKMKVELNTDGLYIYVHQSTIGLALMRAKTKVSYQRNGAEYDTIGRGAGNKYNNAVLKDSKAPYYKTFIYGKTQLLPFMYEGAGEETLVNIKFYDEYTSFSSETMARENIIEETFVDIKLRSINNNRVRVN